MGRLKWFDRKRGFGFIAPNDGGSDVLIHCTIITEHGRRDLPDGTIVTFVCGDGPRGRHVECLVAFELPPEDEGAERKSAAPVRKPAPGPAPEDFSLSTVKWFSRVKGYGFVTVDHLESDIFLHMELLRSHDLEPVKPGDKIYARIVDSDRGPVVDALHGDIITED